MAKISVCTRPHKGKDGRLPVYLRITHRQVTRYVALGLYVKPKDWNAREGRFRKSHPATGRDNAYLDERQQVAEGALLALRLAGRVLTADLVKRRVEESLVPKEQESEDFLAYARGLVKGYQRRAQILSAERLRVILNKFEAYAGPVSFDELTPALIRGFETYLVEVCRNAPNTVAKNLKGLRTMIKTAIREGRFPQENYPFFGITIRETRTTKTKLTREELSQMEGLRLAEDSWEVLARDAFLFATYAAGIRFGDLCCLSFSSVRSDGHLAYTMMKTVQQHEIALPEKALAIVRRYEVERKRCAEWVFPFLDGRAVDTKDDLRNSIDSANTMTNKFLKQVAAKAGIEKTISFHVSRHTFAHTACKSGWGLYGISKALGHSSLRMTETYLASLEDHGLDEKMRALF